MDATGNELVETQYYGCCVVDLYNQRRRHSTLGQISPAAYERQASRAFANVTVVHGGILQPPSEGEHRSWGIL
jgi:hypothetical protein